MNTGNWKDVVDIVGVAAIVASLIFVGLQLQQSHKIALAEIYQARTTTVVEAGQVQASNPHILNAYTKAYSGRVDELEPQELLAAEWAVWGELMLNENSHYQYMLGYLPEEHWQRVRRNLKNNMQLPLDKDLIQKSKVGMSKQFQSIIEEIERELASESGN